MNAEQDFNKFRKLWEREVAYADLPDTEYHSTIAMSAGQLKTLMDSAAHFKSLFLSPKGEPTPAMRFGNICHKAILEGPEFRARYRIIPEFKGTGSKAAKADWMEENKNAILITEEEEIQIAGMLESVMAHPVARALIEGCESRTEISGFFNHEGLRCKMRADIWRADDVIVDLKTTKCSAEREFTRDAWDLCYPIQPAWYLLGASKICKRPIRTFAYIAVEKSPPYPVAVYTASPTFIEAGERLVQIALKRFHQALDSGEFLAYSQQALDLQLPPWALRDLEEIERVSEIILSS